MKWYAFSYILALSQVENCQDDQKIAKPWPTHKFVCIFFDAAHLSEKSEINWDIFQENTVSEIEYRPVCVVGALALLLLPKLPKIRTK